MEEAGSSNLPKPTISFRELHCERLVRSQLCERRIVRLADLNQTSRTLAQAKPSKNVSARFKSAQTHQRFTALSRQKPSASGSLAGKTLMKSTGRQTASSEPSFASAQEDTSSPSPLRRRRSSKGSLARSLHVARRARHVSLAVESLLPTATAAATRPPYTPRNPTTRARSGQPCHHAGLPIQPIRPCRTRRRRVRGVARTSPRQQQSG